jgi:hypothetical protein
VAKYFAEARVRHFGGPMQKCHKFEGDLQPFAYANIFSLRIRVKRIINSSKIKI